MDEKWQQIPKEERNAEPGERLDKVEEGLGYQASLIVELIEQVTVLQEQSAGNTTPSADLASQLAKTKRTLEITKSLWGTAHELNSKLREELDVEKERRWRERGELQERIDYLELCLADLSEKLSLAHFNPMKDAEEYTRSEWEEMMGREGDITMTLHKLISGGWFNGEGFEALRDWVSKNWEELNDENR